MPSDGKHAACWLPCSRQQVDNDEDEEAASAPVKSDKPSAAAAAPAKSADPVPMPRSKPVAAASPTRFGRRAGRVRSQIETQPEFDQAAQASAENAEPKPQTPADIINARGFWDDAPGAPKQATPAQVAALSAPRGARLRRRSATDRQRYQYLQQGHGLCAGSRFPGRARRCRRGHRADAAAAHAPGAQSPAATTEINTVVAKGARVRTAWSRLEPLCRRQGQR